MVLEGGKLQKDSDAKNSHSCCRQETWFGTHFRRVDALPFGDVDVLLISSLQVSPPRSSATSSSHMTIDTFHLFPQQDWFASPHRHISVFRLEAMTLDDGNVKEFHHLAQEFMEMSRGQGASNCVAISSLAPTLKPGSQADVRGTKR